MPKTLILFHGSSGAVAAMADAVAEGAREVRFAEVDVRRLAPPTETGSASQHRILSSVGELTGYDGLVIGMATGVVSEAISRLLAEASELRRGGGLTASAGAAFVGGAGGTEADDTRWRLLRGLADLGVVLVPASGDGPEAAKKLGHRVAHVVSWITHARSHGH